MKHRVYFVSGIDTGVGKSYATGYIAKKWNEEGVRTITQKFVQTGNDDVSEDIELHRRIMGIPFVSEDDSRLTMPEIYTYPCSPHLAAEIDGRPIDLRKIGDATAVLGRSYDTVLIEGAGGLMVPLTRDYLTIDYIAEKNFPLILVTSGKLGSINHTLLSIEAVLSRGINLEYVAFNEFPRSEDSTIADDTKGFIRSWLMAHSPSTSFLEIPLID